MDKSIEKNEISQLYSLTLGGYRQKVLVEGKKKDNPIVITLHGGPGTPIPFSVGCRGLFPEFTDEFLMVYWDQLGCGINNHIIDDSFTVDTFVQMTEDLVEEMKAEFPGKRFATDFECPSQVYRRISEQEGQESAYGNYNQRSAKEPGLQAERL